MTTASTFQTALAHVAPVFLDRQATVDKSISLIREAAHHGARLIVFPETYIPAFPVWSALRRPIDNHDLFRRLVAQSLRVPGPELHEIQQAAREAELYVSLGLNESTSASVGCLFNTNVLIGPDGTLLNHHRKLMPTFYEKLTWAPGDGAGLRVCETALGNLGMLICGENTNPLARYTLMAQGEQIHCASYPPIWPTHDPSVGTNYNMAHAIQLRAAAHSFEAKAFTLVAAGFMDAQMFDFLAALAPDAARILEGSPRGVSLATGPAGELISAVRSDEEGLVYVQIDPQQCVEPKQIHDVSGGYNRFDVFHLRVNRERQTPIGFGEKLPDEETGSIESAAPRDRLDG